MQHKKAIIIGSGIGGMATAIRLAVKGYAVTVFEKNDTPGGKLTAFTKQGFHFDAGPSLFTQPQNILELFELAGEPVEKYFSYKAVDIACRYFYENGKIVNAYTDPAVFAKELEQQVNERPEHVIDYLKKSGEVYNSIGTLFLNNSLHKSKTWLNKKVANALMYFRPSLIFKTLNEHNTRKFTAPETVQLFNRFATYNGSNPFKAPSMLSLIPHLEQNQGTYYPAGGMISITSAIYQLAKAKGVKFIFNTPVQRIIHTEGKIKGVVAGDKNIFADVVVSNADAYFTYKNLLKNNIKALDILKQERSSSAIIFYWGIKKKFPQLELHNIFFSADYKEEFRYIFKTAQVYNDPTVYINITAKEEAGQAPPGKENWFVMINVPPNKNQDWGNLTQSIRAATIAKLNRLLNEDIELLIETEVILDPVLIESQTASYMGSLYGTSSNSTMAAFFRHPNFTNKIKGLYFCGGSVHPGGGIPLCLKSAKIVSDLVTANDKTNNHN